MKATPASGGIAIGKVYLWESDPVEVKERSILSVDDELTLLRDAKTKCEVEITSLREHTAVSIGQKEAEVFDAHIMILSDPEWFGKITEMIQTDQVAAEIAVVRITDGFLKLFELIEDEYLRERATDLKDVTSRLLGHLLGKEKRSFIEDDKVILIANDLVPSDTAQLDKRYVQGIITEMGNKTSHTAIIARTMGIPAIVGAKGIVSAIKEASVTKLAFDGSTGEYVLNPTDEQEVAFEKLMAEEVEEKQKLEGVRGKDTITLDGYTLELACNIAKPEEASLVSSFDGEGVGLFRTEILFMNRTSAPTEEEQFATYKKTIQLLHGKPLIIRTLDAGGDKQVDYLNIEPELNPFLGYRAIRICLKETQLFKQQLRAVLRASAYGPTKLMFPMIATINEFLQAKELVKEVMSELEQKGSAFDKDIPIGIMVEIPSTAVLAEQFAKHVDFFSIGTNDLTQYTLAADRMNENLTELYQHLDPAVLSLIANVIRAARKHGKWVGMCGEAASDPMMVPFLIGLGIHELSMAPISVLPTRSMIRKLSKKDCEKLVDEVLSAGTVDEVKSMLMNV